MTDLERAADELRRAALKLREPGLEPAELSALVEECARLAAEAGAELERLARATAADDPAPGQGELL